MCALDPHGTGVTFIGTGQCVIDASEAGNATYAPATAQLSFTVEAADQYIRFTSIARSIGWGTSHDLSARPGASGLPVVFTIGDPVSASGGRFLRGIDCGLHRRWLVCHRRQ